MGIILGALAGAGGQAIDLADKSIAQDNALEREKFTSDLAMGRDKASSDLAQQRAEALELFKEDRTNVQRGQMVARTNAAAGQIADQKASPELQSKYAQENAGIVDKASWTPEMAAAMEQSRELDQPDRKGIIDKSLTDGSAGLRSGDITAKDAMGNASKLEINQIKMDNLLARAADRNQSQQEIAQVRAEAMKYGYELRLQAAQEKKNDGKIDNATGRMIITSEDANIRSTTSLINITGRQLDETPKMVDGKPNPRRAQLEKEIDEYKEEIRAAQSRKAEFLDAKGVPGAKTPAAPKPGGEMGPPDSAAPAPAPSAPAVPPNAKRVGTSGGKPVYQLPDGTQFIPK